jgi:hypothetical protein
VDHDYHGRLKAGDIASVLADYNGKGDGEAE